MLSVYFSALPFALPTFLTGVVLSLLVVKRIAKWTNESPTRVLAWMASLTLILSTTLTPAAHAFDMDSELITTRVWTWATPDPGALLTINWQSMNFALFTPIGLASGLLVQRGNATSGVVAAYAIAALVEVIQYLAIPLGRSQFNSATVIIGWVGITVGLIMGAGLRRLSKNHYSTVGDDEQDRIERTPD